MDTRPDVFSPDSQLFFDLEAAESVLVEERVQLAAARLAYRLAVRKLISDPPPLAELDKAITRHEAIIAEVLAFADASKEISTPVST